MHRMECTKKIQRQIRDKIRKLEHNPRPANSKQLRGFKDFHRITSGVYRIVYKIEDKKIEVLVLRISHRKNVYRNLPRH